MHKNLAVVVIPTHKSILRADEVLSLSQCVKILGKHPLVVVCPTGMDVSNYKAISNKLNFEYVPSSWMASYRSYNQMKMNPEFYKIFSGFESMLTHELDAYVFDDQLFHWCQKNYDYIGAPWFEDFGQFGSTKLWRVGNSGFSLRNIQKCIEILDNLSIWDLKKMLKSNFIGERGLSEIFKCGANFIAPSSTFRRFFKTWAYNEDQFWTLCMTAIFDDFKVAPISEATGFSFECHPKVMFELNQKRLPFGCHAWARYDRDFWAPYIEHSQFGSQQIA